MTTTSPKLKVINNHAYANSLDLAMHFHKRHDDVLRAIRKTLTDCSEEFNLRNFTEITRRDSRGRWLPVFNLTRDGFAIVAMSLSVKVQIQSI